MKVNGGMFRNALRRWSIRLEAAAKQFDGALYVFPVVGDPFSETKATQPTPQELVTEMLRAEDAIARLQVGQARYNLAVKVKVGDSIMTMTEAVKHVGVAGRIEKLWRKASMVEVDIYSPARRRSTAEVDTIRTVPIKEAVELAVKTTGYAESLRSAINRGNQTEITLEDLVTTDFE